MISIINHLPASHRSNRYYTGYVNHMWRLFTSHLDQVPDTANDIDRADWSICHTIYTTLGTFEQSIVLAWYRDTRNTTTPDAFQQFCLASGITETSAHTILAAITTRTAEQRGLIAKRDTRIFRPYRMDGARKAEEG